MRNRSGIGEGAKVQYLEQDQDHKTARQQYLFHIYHNFAAFQPVCGTMGRDKKAQRTKGNKQPSSSGRTADLLGGVGGLVGFGGLQDLGYVPAASQCQGADETVAASLRVALRKMTKKDATTKIKALQEFEALCQTESQEAVLSALPFWPRLYAKLSIDVERRVREGVQSCHRVLSSRVGRQMAPHLKVIMPAWVTAVCDPHTLAADAAAKAFQVRRERERENVRKEEKSYG
ncbi:E3 ubiquitin-protein ligase listerin [Portunus trituberculatus]|uniref:E3 ubiquitin-protein ligase listerin n=1 Tax=Portunus trituberculatus TaxID=210409 RepID=A0A5B7CUR7_PORTR|nr:E3 ubiquitin-protein ligase listerin [Portunus trituberculatus]